MVAADSNSPGRAPRRSRADVVDAAVALLDRVGLPDLTMRRLADELGVQPSALYWHISNKQHLLAAVSAQILGTGETAPGTASTSLPAAAASVLPEPHPARLADAARTLGRRLHDRLLAHRDGAEVVSSSLALGLVDSPLHVGLERTARATGDALGTARVVADAVTHFVVGYTFHEQQRRAADGWGVAADTVAVSPDRVGDPADDGFTAALELILAGAASTIDRAAAPAGAHPLPPPARS